MTTDLRVALLRALIAGLAACEPPADVLSRAEAQRAIQAANRRRNG
jgi:hypothetical protein